MKAREAEWHGKIKSGPMSVLLVGEPPTPLLVWPEAECLYNRRIVLARANFETGTKL
jgi:hypothetical protein